MTPNRPTQTWPTQEVQNNWTGEGDRNVLNVRHGLSISEIKTFFFCARTPKIGTKVWRKPRQTRSLDKQAHFHPYPREVYSWEAHSQTSTCKEPPADGCGTIACPSSRSPSCHGQASVCWPPWMLGLGLPSIGTGANSNSFQAKT